MRRIVLAALSTLSTLVLLFSYHTSLNRPGTASAASAPLLTDTGSSGSGSASSGSGSASSGSGSASSGSASSADTFTGSEVMTRWGVVQVQITVTSGKITAVEAIQYPDGNRRDQEINASALPVLQQEVLQTQGAQIDAVSGATVTSDGYLQSLQSALDAANL